MPNFYGPNEIVSQKDEGKNHIKLMYKNGETEIISKLLYEAAKTEEGIDLTALREKRMEPVLLDIMGLLLKYDIKPFEPMNEVDYIVTRVKASYEDSFRKADAKKWGFEKKDLKFSDIHKTLIDK